MEHGHFYFLTDKYFEDFTDPYLMRNHEMVGDKPHNRPCFLAFKDSLTELYWMIPVSSQIDKYNGQYSAKISKYGKCDTIVFGEILGHKSAFLIQNMCPVAADYVSNEYVDYKTNLPVRINFILEKEIISKAKKTLLLQRKGFSLIFPDVLSIEKKLLDKVQYLSQI